MTNRLYFNLTSKVFSVQAKNQNNKWRLQKHYEECWITDLSFFVSEPTRQRVIRENKKFVHAFLIGDVKEVDDMYDITLHGCDNYLGKVVYNPRYNKTFQVYQFSSSSYVSLDSLSRQYDLIAHCYITTDNTPHIDLYAASIK